MSPPADGKEQGFYSTQPEIEPRTICMMGSSVINHEITKSSHNLSQSKGEH
jgi:hypothetical protein